jgi:hypothetical protein
MRTRFSPQATIGEPSPPRTRLTTKTNPRTMAKARPTETNPRTMATSRLTAKGKRTA